MLKADIDIEIKVGTGGQVQISYDGYGNYSNNLIGGMIALYEEIGEDLTDGQKDVIKDIIYRK